MSANGGNGKVGLTNRVLNWIERAGNKLPDPAMIFFLGMVLTWIVSACLSDYEFDVPRKTSGLQDSAREIAAESREIAQKVDSLAAIESGKEDGEYTAGAGEVKQSIAALNKKVEKYATAATPTEKVRNQLSGEALATFLSKMVNTFAHFHPLGVVLVALLGVGVAERSGFINAVLKQMLQFTPRLLLTPMLILVAIVSHSAADAGYVLVIPLGGVIFYAAGRHPLAGIAAAFAGVSGGFSANFIPSGIDPLLQGLTQVGVDILDPSREVNPLCNLLFTGLSSILIIGVGWFITDRIIEPRLASTEVDGDPDEMPKMEKITGAERRGMVAGLIAMGVGILLLGAACWSESSPLRSPDPALKGDGFKQLTAFSAPLMKSIVPLIFILFLIPGVVHGYVSKAFKSHKDMIAGMSSTMSTMGYYLVMAFFASLFIYSFNESKLGMLIAVKGAAALKAMGLPASMTICGIILLCATINLLVGSASAKWALLAPIFVPMLMTLGLSPELTQAAYRVGDSTTNIITPLMPYFPLVVTFAQRYCKGTGLGTVMSLMIPYSVIFLFSWTIFLLIYWQLGIPLGFGATYTYTP